MSEISINCFGFFLSFFFLFSSSLIFFDFLLTPFFFPKGNFKVSNGIEIDSSGRVYVVDHQRFVVQVFGKSQPKKKHETKDLMEEDQLENHRPLKVTGKYTVEGHRLCRK